MVRICASLLLCAMLASCGGGGSGGGGSAPAPAPASGGTGNGSGGTPSGALAVLAPSPLTLTAYSGYSTEFTVEAVASTSITGSVYVVISDPVGVITTDISLKANSTYDYTATLNTSPALTAGHHTGNLQVDLCKDPTCGSKWGSTILLPYDFNVLPGSSAPPFATISPASINETLYGEVAVFSLGIFPAAPLAPLSHTYISVSQTAGSPFHLSAASELGFNGTTYVTASILPVSQPGGVSTDTVAGPGTYSGNISVNLCRDTACKYPLYGAPFLVPYHLTILPSTNLTSLSALPGVGNWETYQGNAAHTGYVPVTLDPTRFSQRWARGADAFTHIAGVAAGNGKVYISGGGGGSSATSSLLEAVSESDGSLAWKHDFGTSSDLEPPALSGGTLYVVSKSAADASRSTWTGKINAISAADGSQIASAAISIGGVSHQAPAVAGGAAYAGGGDGFHGYVYRYDGQGDSLTWTASTSADCGNGAPAADANYAYAYTPSGIVENFDAATGTGIRAINAPGGIGCVTDRGVSPVLAGNNTVIVAGGTGQDLTAFDMAQGTVKWNVGGGYTGTPAVAGGVVYALNLTPFQLEARSLADGSLKWSWSPASYGDASFLSFSGTFPYFVVNPEIPSGSLIVTDNLAFVTTDTRLYAIDLFTHQPVWRYYETGALAMSPNGILYVFNANNLFAVNLK